MKGLKGFTLSELIITMVIVVILSLISLPIYKNRHSNYAKLAEGYALLGALKEAQINYYNEYGYFLGHRASGFNCDSPAANTCYNPVLGISAANNKYFTLFNTFGGNSTGDYSFTTRIEISVFSKKAGTIRQTIDVRTHFEPQVINGSTDLNI